jgi:hypothetical protein
VPVDATREPSDALAARLAAAARGKASGLTASRAVYVAWRQRGQRIHEEWIEGGSLDSTLASATKADVVEVALSFDYRAVEPETFARALRDRDRGIRGVVISHEGRSRRFAPSRMIASNQGFERVLEVFCEENGVARASFFEQGGKVESFAARTVLVPLDGRLAHEIYRGARLVKPVTPAVVREAARGMSQWLVRNTAHDGRIPYKYWPSTGKYSPANNTIRQLMATVCLGRIERVFPDLGAAAAFARNLTANLADFFQEHDGVGTIAFGGSAKLGAAALAALAILEQEGTSGAHARELAALMRGVDALWNEDGSFRTFHFPKDRNDNQNFYPGEALVFWAALWSRTRDAALLDRFMRSFRYYRGWHAENRNPAFVPWHTQAYATVYRITGEAELLDFILHMNDWLLAMQQGDEAGYPDLVGRFYDPNRTEFGPPHASSTGVYLEGLADAFDLTQKGGDESRARAYASAIAAGIRNLRQLQFKDDADMFYVSRRERVAGGVRTNAYDNTIRVDNVQHGLMALLKLIDAGQVEAIVSAPSS